MSVAFETGRWILRSERSWSVMRFFSSFEQ